MNTNLEFSHFTSKEHYLAFRAAWAKTCNDPKFTKKSMDEYGNKTCLLRSEHFILYNMLRGRNPMTGFSPITNTNKLQSVSNPYARFHNAIHTLWAYSRWAVRPKEELLAYTQGRILNEFLEPFDGTVSYEMLVNAYAIYKLSIKDGE